MGVHSVVALIVLLTAPTAGAQRRSIFGAYQDCPFACLTIQVKPDHTFIYRLDGDVYNDERTLGTWAFIGRKKVHAVSPGNHTAPRVQERTAPGESNFLVEVIDQVGAVIGGANVRVVSALPDFASETNERGLATISRCDEFEIAFGGYRGRYRPRDRGSNAFTVSLTVEQMSAVAIDEVWLIDRGRLYIANADESFDRHRSLGKLSRAKERAIFR